MNVKKVTVCADCRMPIAYGDFTALDFHYNTEDSNRRYQEISEGMDKLVADGGYLTLEMSDSEPEEPDYFDSFTCECCGAKSSSERYTALVIKD